MRSVAGLHLRLGDAIDPEVNARVHALARALEAVRLPGVTEVIPSYASVYVEYDLAWLDRVTVRRWAEGAKVEATEEAGRAVSLSVRYDGADLEYVAKAAGIDVAEVVHRHSAVEYRVYAVGFTPGFPFMAAVDPLIRVPRLEVPRPRVEAHTVAIAEAQTGIYPLPSPGGWRQLGTALEAVYDPHRQEPFLLQPGDRVRFVPVPGAEPPTPEPLELLPAEPSRPVLAVHEPGLLDLVLDAGRFGAGRFGLARSGPLDARSAAAANRLVGNSADAPLLEINVQGPVMEAVSDCVVAFAGFGVSLQLNRAPALAFTSLALRRGDRLAFPPQSRGVRGYLAVAGGLESGVFMGSASTDVRGLIGRPLRAGDVLGAAADRRPRPGFSFEPYVRWPAARRWSAVISEAAAVAAADLAAVTLRLLPGPQANIEARRALTSLVFRVERADRMGLQLDRGQPADGRRAAAARAAAGAAADAAAAGAASGAAARGRRGTGASGAHGEVGVLGVSGVSGVPGVPGVPGGSILSEATPLGAVQVTPGGKPLILLHDRGTIGGYAKPAVLHPGDLPIAGQLRAGDRVRFVRV